MTRRPAVATAGHWATLAVAAVLLPWFNRNQWFFGDEWEFFANRMSGFGNSLFAPHNEHWSTLPIAIYRVLYGAFGLRTYLPYVLVLVAFHLATTHLVWRIMNRSGVAPLLSTALAAVFALLGSGGENLLWAFQIGFVGSVAFGLLQVHLADHPGPFGRRDRLGWGAAVLGLLCSGMGVTMTAAAGIAVLLRRGVKDAVKTVSLPAGVYLVWLAVVGYEGLDSHERSLATLLQVPTYIWTGLSSALERASGIPAAGAVLVLVLGVWLLHQRAVVRTEAATPTAMALGAVVLFTVTAVGRSGLGVEQSTAGRYVYVALALLLPAAGLMLTDAARGDLSRELALAGVLGLVVVHNVGELRTASHAEADREASVRRQVLAAAALVEAGEDLVATQPEPGFSPDITVDHLRRFRRQGTLPGGTQFGEVDRLAAATQLQVALTDDAQPLGGRDAPVLPGGVAVDMKGCTVLQPGSAVDLPFTGSKAVSLRSPAGGELTVVLHSPADPAVTGPPRRIALAPVATHYLRVARPGTVTLVMPPAGGTEVCGVGSAR